MGGPAAGAGHFTRTLNARTASLAQGQSHFLQLGKTLKSVSSVPKRHEGAHPPLLPSCRQSVIFHNRRPSQCHSRRAPKPGTVPLYEWGSGAHSEPSPRFSLSASLHLNVVCVPGRGSRPSSAHYSLPERRRSLAVLRPLSIQELPPEPRLWCSTLDSCLPSKPPRPRQGLLGPAHRREERGSQCQSW